MRWFYVMLFLVAFTLAGCSNDLEVLEGSGPVGVSRQYIINGEPSANEAVVGLHQLTNVKGGSIYIKPFCTGTLISPSVVLTAAHCLDGAGDTAPTRPMKPTDIAVYLGDNPADDDDGDGRPNVLDSLYFVQELQINNAYNKFSITDDIGLIRLAQETSGVETIGPLPADKSIVASDIDQLNLHIVGFGQSDASDSSSYGYKLEGDVVLSDILPNNQIEHTYNTNDPNNDNAICFGDSGGPAFVERDGITYVAGVASYVTAPYCENTGVHTKVDAYLGFIADFSPICGDSVCSDSEDCAFCPEDCGTCPTCDELDCNDNDLCTVDSCDPDTATCSYVDVVCEDDGDMCTAESCDPDTGGCISTAVVCDDEDPCTDDTCDSIEGCRYVDNGTCICLSSGASCTSNDECCSGKCNPGRKICK